jgi:hypothetical protein
MSHFDDPDDLIELFPPVQPGTVPSAFSRGRFWPNLLIRNDGFAAEVVFVLEELYLQFAATLAVIHMALYGIALVEVSNPRRVEVRLLYDSRHLSPANLALDAQGKVYIEQNANKPLSHLHRQPERWRFDWSLSSGEIARFVPVDVYPLAFVDRHTGLLEGGPTLVIAYGNEGLLMYAARQKSLGGLPSVQKFKAITDERVIEVLTFIAREVMKELRRLL